MTAPQQSCPRCHLYLSARGCTPERCANPEGAAELERMNAGLCQGFLRGPCELPGGHAGKHHSAMDGGWSEREPPPNDLAEFCSLLGRMGCSYERGKTRTGWYVRTAEGYFFFDAASGRFRTNGIDPAERAEFDKWIARREADLPVTAVVRKQGPASDLDAFRAMLERAGIDREEMITGDKPLKQVVFVAGVEFEFDDNGKLVTVE